MSTSTPSANTEPPASDHWAHGSCLCGAVRFAARLPSKWVAHCHCTRCRRAHGAAFVTWAGFEAAAVNIEDTGQRLVWHDGIEGARRGHCGVCGTPMFFDAPRWPGELHIARALFDDAPDREPQAHVSVENAVPWVHLDDALPRVVGNNG